MVCGQANSLTTNTKVASKELHCVHIAVLQPEGEDELKKLQLMELAIMNGTFRDNKQLIANMQRKFTVFLYNQP